MIRGATSPVVVAGSVVGAVAGAALAIWALSAAAKPTDFDRRMAAIEQQLAGLERVPPARQSSAYAATSLCAPPLIPAANSLRDGLMRQAATAGVAAPQVGVALGGTGPSLGLSQLEVSLTVEGPYANARRFLGGLQASSPEVFIDSFEIRPASGGVRMRVTGRAICWTSSRP